MDCKLCDRPIDPYDPAFNHLALDDGRSADLCQGCIDRFVEWRQQVLARLFPTRVAKKRFGPGSPPKR